MAVRRYQYAGRLPPACWRWFFREWFFQSNWMWAGCELAGTRPAVRSAALVCTTRSFFGAGHHADPVLLVNTFTRDVNRYEAAVVWRPIPIGNELHCGLSHSY